MIKINLPNFLELITVLAGSTLICWCVFHTHDYLIEMTSNADSLSLLDFSRDILRGVPLDAWNLPRAPYFLPDILIASLVLLGGWSNNYSIIAIASINYSLLIITSYFVLHHAYGLKGIKLPSIFLAITISLFVITYVFPVSIYNVYWQIFTSGSHFGTAVVVALMLSLNKLLFQDDNVLPKVLFLTFFTIALVASNAMTLLLLMLWIVSELFTAAWKQPRGRIDLIVVFTSVIVGLGLSLIIPRQSLTDSFFSTDKIVRALHLFYEWFTGAFGNTAFICTMIASVVVFPYLMEGRWPNSGKNISQSTLGKAFSLQALGLIAITPIFFEAAGSLRYLIFPAFIFILCLVLIYYRLLGLVKSKQDRVSIFYLWFALIFFSIFITYDRFKAGPAYELNVAKSYKCIKQASLEYPLQDGIASYWNARPVKFYSNFDFYLAQVSPWRPAEGYFYWGNNWYDFIYKNTIKKLPRKYNYILATNEEIQSGIWGDVINQSKNKLVCSANTLFYFDDTNILWDFLFSRGPPPHLKKLNSGLPLITKRNLESACPTNAVFCSFTLDNSKLLTQVGIREGNVINANGSPGYLVYGPYVTLESGEYQLNVKGNLSGASKELGIIDIATDLGEHILMTKPITTEQIVSDNIVSLNFKLVKPAIVEFRINIQALTIGTFKAYELTKVNLID